MGSGPQVQEPHISKKGMCQWSHQCFFELSGKVFVDGPACGENIRTTSSSGGDGGRDTKGALGLCCS